MTLSEAQRAFRASPSRHTALAYMDAAIEKLDHREYESWAAEDFSEQMREIRDWLMNERPPRDITLWPEGAESQ